MKLFTIIGARPQFVKAAVLSRLIRSDEWKDNVQEILLHTGQHYDDNMSEIFFRDMMIPKPDIHLAVGSGTHGHMTGKMLTEIESALLREKPDMVLVYGDTNSTLAGALAASKLNIPVAHVEAGLRSYNKRMPEEQNRILTDHLSTLLFCPTEVAVNNLEKEGITEGVSLTGDIMYDATLFYQKIIQQNGRKNLTFLPPELLSDDFALATIHRAENTDDTIRLSAIVEALNNLSLKVVLPLHPRTRKIMKETGLSFSSNVTVTEPLGYFEILELESKALCLITDSGGMQKEAYFMNKPCITLRDETEWVETVGSGWNLLAGANSEKIIETVKALNSPSEHPKFYGDGDAGRRILEIITLQDKK